MPTALFKREINFLGTRISDFVYDNAVH